jgi:transposase-like protein
MFTHEQIWEAIDQLAERHGYSPSGLARQAGLDPTTFNKSKRTSSEGKPRWPSTESISKILAVTGEQLPELLQTGERDQPVLRKGQNIVLRTKDHEMLTGTFLSEDDNGVLISSIDTHRDLSPRERHINRNNISWMAHVIYAG